MSNIGSIDNISVLQLLESVSVKRCLLIPRSQVLDIGPDLNADNPIWIPGELSFQLVISGQIATTAYADHQETILRKGGLICCAPGAASTRNYNVARKHLSFVIHDDHIHMQLYKRQADDRAGQSQIQQCQFPAAHVVLEMKSVLLRGFRENVESTTMQQLAMSVPALIIHSLLVQQKQQAYSTQLMKAQQWLQDYACMDYDRNDLAKYLHCHPDHVTRLFRHGYGGSFANERKRLRCERACALLADPNLSLTGIATTCGFNSQTYFIRSFKQTYACTPGEWRQNQCFAG